MHMLISALSYVTLYWIKSYLSITRILFGRAFLLNYANQSLPALQCVHCVCQEYISHITVSVSAPFRSQEHLSYF